jgi:hypothetical protein
MMGGALVGLAPRAVQAQEMDTCYDTRWGSMGCFRVESFNFRDPAIAEDERYLGWRAWVLNSPARMMNYELTNLPSGNTRLASMGTTTASSAASTRPASTSSSPAAIASTTGVSIDLPRANTPPGPMPAIVISPADVGAPTPSLGPGRPGSRDEISVRGAYEMASAKADYCVVYGRGC